MRLLDARHRLPLAQVDLSQLHQRRPRAPPHDLPPRMPDRHIVLDGLPVR